MQESKFVEQAGQFGDFYLFYRKEGSRSTTYLVGTLDMNNKYIQARIGKGQLDKSKLRKDEVFVWSWSSDKLRKIKLSAIKKLSPLSAVLRNYRD